LTNRLFKSINNYQR